MPRATAYLPIQTYPEPPSDAAVLAVLQSCAALGTGLHVMNCALEMPTVSSALGGLLLDVPSLARRAEQFSRDHCARLAALLQKAADGLGVEITAASCTGFPAVTQDACVIEARHYDLVLIPWSQDAAAGDMAQAMIFGAGRPVMVIPESKPLKKFDHVAIAWDGSRVAARALGDALALTKGNAVSVLTVSDEKSLDGGGLAGALASALGKRGFQARGHDIKLQGRRIADALQQESGKLGADLLAMGGYGHSRLRDFVLGGATAGVLSAPAIPVLLSH